MWWFDYTFLFVMSSQFLLCPSCSLLRSPTGLQMPGDDWRTQWDSQTWVGHSELSSTTNMFRAMQRGWVSAVTTAAQKVGFELQRLLSSKLYSTSKEACKVKNSQLLAASLLKWASNLHMLLKLRTEGLQSCFKYWVWKKWWSQWGLHENPTCSGGCLKPAMAT